MSYSNKNEEIDEICKTIIISGIPCLIQAKNVNGKIKGNVSCSLTIKNYKFDLSPSQSKKTHIDLIMEIKRLYFTLKKSKSHKIQLQLESKESIEDAEKFTSFLV